MKLVDEADRHAPQGGPSIVGHVSGLGSLDENLAAIRLLQQTRDVKQRRLAGAGWPHQGYRLTRPDSDIRATKDVEPGTALAIVPLDLREPQGRHAHS